MKASLPILLACVLSSYAETTDSLTEENLDQLHRLMQAKPEEMIWKDSIPWRTDLWAARREAAEKGKPIYLWEMDGHPLGCT